MFLAGVFANIHANPNVIDAIIGLSVVLQSLRQYGWLQASFRV
jgi:hypothetical protein